MTRLFSSKKIGISLAALATSLLLVAAPSSGAASEDAAAAKKQLLEMTGGRRVKVVWGQQAKNNRAVYKYFDTKEGVIRELPFDTRSGDVVFGQIWLTPNGRRVVALTVKPDGERTLVMYDTESKKVTKLADGPDCYPVAIWNDPKTKIDWVYVNDCAAEGPRKRGWDAGRDKLYRFPLDKPEARELFWDRTTSHEFLSFSADGTHACFAPVFSNIGDMTYAFDAAGKVDQDNSKFKTAGHGCFSGMIADNSYRLFHLEGAHKAIMMYDAGGANARKIDITGMPGVGEKGLPAWLTRASTNPRYITIMAPCNNDSQIWVGRFDEGFTKIEKWVKVSGDAIGCQKSHSWVEPERTSRWFGKRK